MLSNSSTNGCSNGVGCLRYGPPADVWSFGILVLELAMGRPPRVGRSLTAIILSTMHDDAPQLTASNFSQVCGLGWGRARTGALRWCICEQINN